jgi:hypothetical protein
VEASSTTYTISFYGKLGSGSISDLSVRYSPDGTATSDCSVTAINSASISSTTGWTRYFCAVSSATAPTTSGFVRINLTGTTTGRVFYIDAVQMEQNAVSAMNAYSSGTINWDSIIQSPTTFKNAANSVNALQVQSASGANLFNVDTLNNQLQVYSGSCTSICGFATISYNDGTNTATFAASSGTTAIGNGTGPTNIAAGSSSNTTIDSGTSGSLLLGTSYNQPITVGSVTNTGALTLQGGSGNITLTTSTGNKVQIGSSTTDTNSTILVLDSYSTASDPTGVLGGMYYSTSSNTFRCFQNSVWRNCIESPSNSSTADQAPAAATLTYLTGSSISIPTEGVQAGTQFIWRMSVSKTIAGTAAPTFAVVFGTAGTTADTARASFTLPTETAAVDTAQITIICTVRSVSATATISCNLQLVHNAANAVGFVATASSGSVVLTATSATFDDTVAGSKIGVTVNSNTNNLFTFQQVQAQSINL